ncbi:MAG: MFS transporter [Candidatus Eremiobacteraeota bacterium]|nr:MFS transporter [Candidatus Eremiobacteraeota bacterium]
MKNKNNSLFSSIYILVGVANFFIMTGSQMINILYPLKLQDMGKDDTQIGYIMGIFAVAGFISRFVAGHRIDKMGRLFFIRLGASLLVLCAFLYSMPITNDFYIMFIRIIHGFAWGIYFVAIFTWIADYAPEGRMAEAIGIFGISGLLTIASGPYLGELVLRHTSNNFVILFMSASVVVLTGIILYDRVKDINAGEAVKLDGGMKEVLKNRKIYPALFISILFGLGISLIYTFMAPFAREVKIGTVAPFFTAYTVGAIIFRLFSGKISDMKGRASMIIPALLLISITQSYLFRMDSVTSSIIMGFLLGNAHGMSYPALNAFIFDIVGKERRGAGMGLFTASVDIGYFIGCFLFGYIADCGGFGYMYSVSSIVIMSGLLIFMIWVEMMRKDVSRDH